MVKSKKHRKGVSRTVRHVAVVSTRPGSSTSTVVASRLLRPQALLKEREDRQKKLNESLSGLGGRALEHIRDLHAPGSSQNLSADPARVDESYQDLQDLGDAMDVDEWEDEDDGGVDSDVLHALRDFMGDR
ncbi:hypothetical protein FKP32DRAFT_1579134 [Trametes sanguinea]|nr:hypothetical protein FKP32DRAFT_1579134 [Trametes sanguinea]